MGSFVQTINGYYVTIPWLSVCCLITTILLIVITAEILQSSKSRKRKGKKFHIRKIFVVFCSLLFIFTSVVGTISDTSHLVLCYIKDNKECHSSRPYIRLTADIAYFIAYINLYFVIVLRLYITFRNTRYYLTPNQMCLLSIWLLLSFTLCGVVLVMGYLNDDINNLYNDIIIGLFVIIDFSLNIYVLTLFITNMNKVIVDKTYQLHENDTFSDQMMGKNKNNNNINKIFHAKINSNSTTLTSNNKDNNSKSDHLFSFSNLPDNSSTTTPSQLFGKRHYKNLSLMAVLFMDHKQVTLTTIVTRLTVLTLIVMILNSSYALFMGYYYIFVYVASNANKHRIYGMGYCARGFIAAVNSLIVILNFNFCHKRYYSCCGCCHRSLFRCFAKWNSTKIKALSMHLDIANNQPNQSKMSSVFVTPSSDARSDGSYI